MAGYLHHTAQPSILAAFLPWGVSTGAGCVRPAAANIAKKYYQFCLEFTAPKPMI
jgi:hypothetical protein